MVQRLVSVFMAALAMLAATATSGAQVWTDGACQDACAPATLVRHGGFVQQHPHIIAVFWGSWWASGQGRRERGAVIRLLRSLNHSHYAQGLGTYGAAYSVHFDDEAILPGEPPDWAYDDTTGTARAAGSIVRRLGKLKLDRDADLLVFPTRRYTTPLPSLVCQGVHVMSAGYPRYAVAIVNAGLHSRDTCTIPALTIAVSHEWVEQVTDPYSGGWYDSKGEELADECAAGGSQLVPFGSYSIRIAPYYDNATATCYA